MAAMTCPCCGERLSIDRMILMHLASVPEPKDRYDPASEGHTPKGIIAASGIAHCSIYAALQRLQMSGLVALADFKYKMRSWSRWGQSSVYLLTPAGRAVAERIRSAGVGL